MRYRLTIEGRTLIARGPVALLAFLYASKAHPSDPMRDDVEVEPLAPDDPAPGGILVTAAEGEE